jgi:hypothetical protein
VTSHLEFQLGQGSGRKSTFDCGSRFRVGGGRIGEFVDHARCTWCVSNQQGDMAVYRQLADGVDQSVLVCVVETVRDFYVIRSQSII